MVSFFVNLYNFFQRHKTLLYLSLIVFVAGMAYAASQIKFDENITHFFPNTKDTKNISKVFDNLKVKDKIIVMFSANDDATAPDSLMWAAEQLQDKLQQQVGDEYIEDILLKVEEGARYQISDFIYNHLPLFLSDEDYLYIDSLLSNNRIADVMRRNYSNLISPSGMVMKAYIMRDPLSIGSSTLKGLQDFQIESSYQYNNGYIFSDDGSTLLMFITPTYGTGSTGKNEVLINTLEEGIEVLKENNPTLTIEYFGGPSVGVYNARQIKADTMLTVIASLLVIIVFMSLVFKRKIDIILIITPVLFGGLFSLCFISLIQGSISAIAVGAGAVVLGIALSYSIHMIAHQSHVTSPQQLVKELAYPLTVGSFTTIGAFLGLFFTSSELLQNLGLFAALTLIGTTLFCLIYLPHFLNGQAHQKQGRILRAIERFNAYPFEKNKWLIGGIILITVACFFTSRYVGFNSDMTKLSYEPKHLKQAEQRQTRLFDNSDNKTIMFVSVGSSLQEATENYHSTNKKLAFLQAENKIIDYASAERFFVSEEEQQVRLRRWNNFWTKEKKDFVKAAIQAESKTYGFRSSAFNGFYAWLDKDFSTVNPSKENNTFNQLLKSWQGETNQLSMLITQVKLHDSNKENVYKAFEESSDVIIFDRAYFTSKWVSAVNDDFYLILYISSFLIFFALLISYGRLELTLISFLPMVISWIIIVGVMGLFGIQFNIISIILSTFIFGIGDDFSIFIMDGLQNKYRTGKAVLNSHKTAIFFSAFTIIVGMGAMVLAKHPALQSISYMSILGMVAVVLVAYVLEPVIFNFFIANPASKGRHPYTIMGILQTIYAFTIFLIGCLTFHAFLITLLFTPIKKRRKKLWMCYLIMYCCRFLVSDCFFIKKKTINVSNETFKTPSIIIANHQSFIDILRILSLSPRILLMTNKWVWNSPVFGIIIRYVGYFYAEDGYESHLQRMRKRVNEGYSIAIFPEGTRSYDGKIQRYHKGAFYLANELNLEIIPILFYGNAMVLSKAQPLYLKQGVIATKILPRIKVEDFGNDLRTRTKNITAYVRKEYDILCREFSTADNKYFYNTLVKNYIYKGPIEEWYVRIKVSMEKHYRLFDRLIPYDAQITDIGCGYGMMGYMLTMLSSERIFTGIDYDEDKIAVAKHGYLKNNRINFIYADVAKYSFTNNDVFVMNDVLHYMNYDVQQSLLKKCIDHLNPNGMVIVRDGNASDNKKQKVTRVTEVLSTKIFRFNKILNELHFTSTEQMRAVAKEEGVALEIIKNDKFTSNTIYIFRKKN
ncbi:MAG: 1-acyl-sn-glycerol-3-phosphate acyltransferase [Prevotellaceae bacterium]|jgi:1-acyl-sn-glycerol-3-phosphate acyltransferase|nr:1-acyl-sn-glycerol-3-phosphate acyltransferase [Prevotellaceae bacterium]